MAKRAVDGVTRYSLSCNTDTTLDILRARAQDAASFKLVGQVNSELPFMPGAGDLPAEEFSAVLDSPATEFPLFAPPSEPITDTKYAIGLHAAGLVRDGGTLQIGIGQVGDALAQGLIVRHRDNAQFHAIMKRLGNATEPLPALETGCATDKDVRRQVWDPERYRALLAVVAAMDLTHEFELNRALPSSLYWLERDPVSRRPIIVQDRNHFIARCAKCRRARSRGSR